MILVTGHKGFIGRYLTEHLISRGNEIHGLDAIDDDVFQQLSEVPWENITKIYHQGAISDTTETDIAKIYNQNIHFSIELFNRAIEREIPVVYASSASIYGNSDQNGYNPLNYYALSKLTVDLWVEDNIDRFTNIVGFRYFNVYGANENKSDWTMSPVAKFTKQAKETGVIKLFKGSYDMKRDFICVEDVITIITKEHKSGIYDLGTAYTTSFQEVAELIADKYNASIKYIPFPDKLRNKYQFFTRSMHDHKYQFKTVREWLRLH